MHAAGNLEPWPATAWAIPAVAWGRLVLCRPERARKGLGHPLAPPRKPAGLSMLMPLQPLGPLIEKLNRWGRPPSRPPFRPVNGGFLPNFWWSFWKKSSPMVKTKNFCCCTKPPKATPMPQRKCSPGAIKKKTPQWPIQNWGLTSMPVVYGDP